MVTDNLESELSSSGIREIEILRDCNLPELSYIRAELRLPATAISTGSRRAELDLELISGQIRQLSVTNIARRDTE